jgi:hypothetical protein
LNAQILNQRPIRDEMSKLIRTHFPYLTLPKVLEYFFCLFLIFTKF